MLSRDDYSQSDRSNQKFTKQSKSQQKKKNSSFFPLHHSSLVVNKKGLSKKRFYYRALERGASSALLLNLCAAAVNPQTEIRTHCNRSVHHNNQLNSRRPAQTNQSCCSSKKINNNNNKNSTGPQRDYACHEDLCHLIVTPITDTCLLRLIFRVIMFYVTAWSLNLKDLFADLKRVEHQ